MDKLRMMIVDGNAAARRNLTTYFDKMPELEVVATAASCAGAVSKTRRKRPDVVLIDMTLPGLPALAYLEHMEEFENAPRVFIISAAVDDTFITCAMGMGACFYMAKPLDYETLYRRIIEFGRREADDSAHTRATHKLSQAGFKKSMDGHSFLVAALSIIGDNPERIQRPTKELYPLIAKRFGTHPENVERSIRNAISVAWTRGALRESYRLFGLTTPLRARPTNSEFLVLLSESL